MQVPWHAAAAFREGHISLAPFWSVEQSPQKYLQSTCCVRDEPHSIVQFLADCSSQYLLLSTMPYSISFLMLEDPSYTTTPDPESTPLPSAFLLDLHSHLGNSLKSFGIDREMPVKRSSKMSVQ